MQLIGTLGALALVSNAAFAAVPQLLERDDSGWGWSWSGSEKRHHKGPYPPASSLPPIDRAVTATGSSIHYSHTISPFLPNFPTATGIWGTGTAYTSSPAFTCPNLTASTSFVTVTASVTTTTVFFYTEIADAVTGAPDSSGSPTSVLANSTGIYTYSSWNASTSQGTGTSGPIYTSPAGPYTNTSSVATTSTLNSSSQALTLSVTSTSYSNTTSPSSLATSISHANTTVTATQATSTPCDEEVSDPLLNDSSSSTASSTLLTISTHYSNTSATTSTTVTAAPATSTPCDEEVSDPLLNDSSSTTASSSLLSISTLYTNTSTTSTTTRTHSNEPNTISLPTSSISSLALPISYNTGTDLHPTTSFTPTTTITSSRGTGTPNPQAIHCGLHGLAVGDYFLAEFVENRDNEAVTLEGCYHFCAGVYGITMGCESYQFYPEEGTGAPRCDLYGGSVAQSLDSINNYVPNIWYDLGCGDPLSS